MTKKKDWRDTFCGRTDELGRLIKKFEEVAAGQGPRLAVILGDRGMGKTRLAQELYRILSEKYDPKNYWPDASFFFGNNLRVAPDLADIEVRSHFENFRFEDRPMPFLWWGFRLADPTMRNAARADMATHRATLDPHLAPVFFARRVATARKNLRENGLDVSTDFGKSLLMEAVRSIPGIGVAATALELFFQYENAGKEIMNSLQEHQKSVNQKREATLVGADDERLDDILERTLGDLAELLAPHKDLAPLPTIVFCDDAQFARECGDEGVLSLITTLWERATLADWPLLLVLTHWSHEWRNDVASPTVRSCASTFFNSARSAQFGLLVDLHKESTLSELVSNGLPGLPRDDAAILLEKADGNPQVLVELIEMVRRAPAWIQRNDGSLTPYARQEIQSKSTHLSGLILERLQSDATPESVRQAAALSSVQGMEFLCKLTISAAHALGIPDAQHGLSNSEDPFRLIVGVGQGVAGFVQRAYREAAGALVGGHIGDPNEVDQALLFAAISIVDDADVWVSLSQLEKSTMLAVLIGLAQDDKDPSIRRYAGRSLLHLIDEALLAERGPDIARAANLARNFEEGLDVRWDIRDFELPLLIKARRAIGLWYGVAQSSKLANAVLSRTREEAEQLGTIEAYRSLAFSINAVGLVEQARGELEEAEVLHRESLDIRRKLAYELGDFKSQRILSISLNNLGAVVKGLRGWSEAEELYRESLNIRRILAVQTRTPESQRDLSISINNLGHAAKELRGDWAEAESLYEESLEIRRNLAKLKNSTTYLRDLSASLINTGEMAENRGSWEKAYAAFTECLAIRRDLKSRLGTPNARLDVSTALNYLGRLAKAQERWGEAKTMFQESLNIRRELLAQLGIPRFRRLLTNSLDHLGEVEQALGNWMEAEKLYFESLIIRRDLVEKLRTPLSSRNLAKSLNHMGDVAQSRNDGDKARIFFEEGLSVYRMLAAEQKTMQSKRDVGFSLWKCGVLEGSQGNGKLACLLLNEAKEIYAEVIGFLPSHKFKLEAEKIQAQLELDGCNGMA